MNLRTLFPETHFHLLFARLTNQPECFEMHRNDIRVLNKAFHRKQTDELGFHLKLVADNLFECGIFHGAVGKQKTKSVALFLNSQGGVLWVSWRLFLFFFK